MTPPPIRYVINNTSIISVCVDERGKTSTSLMTEVEELLHLLEFDVTPTEIKAKLELEYLNPSSGGTKELAGVEWAMYADLSRSWYLPSSH